MVYGYREKIMKKSGKKYNKRNLIMIILLVIGIVLFILFLKNFDFQSLLVSYKYLHYEYIIPLLITIFIFYLVRSLHFQVLLKSAGILVPFKNVYAATTSALAISTFSPAQSGDLAKLQFLKYNSDIKRRKTLSVFIIEKLLDVFVAGVIGAIFLLQLSTEFFHIQWSVIFIVIGVGCVVSIVVGYIIAKKVLAFRDTLKTLRVQITHWKLVLLGLFISILLWTINGLLLWLVSMIVGIKISYLLCLMLVCTVTLIGAVTMIPGAVGTLEFSYQFFLMQVITYPPQKILLFVICERATMILIFVIALGHLAFFRKWRKK
jgi:glycosyltransferase 2 family protein